MSQHEFQSDNCVPSNPICEGAISVIAETVGHLVAETSIDHITSVTKQLSIGPNAVSLSAEKLSPSECQKSKQEHNKYTKRAHHTLKHVEHHVKLCLESLAHICFNAELMVTESDIIILRQAVDMSHIECLQWMPKKKIFLTDR